MGITLESIQSRMIGNVFGELTVLEYAGRNLQGNNLWKCRCSCGAEIFRTTARIDTPDVACTACKYKRELNSKRFREALLGQVFGRLTVLSYEGVDRRKNTLWKCRCECQKLVVVKAAGLRSGSTKSCGCYARDCARETNKKHGLYKHPLYPVWWAMKERCYNSNCPAYKRYGGRETGPISMCNACLGSFLVFYEWATSHGYERGLTIERIDNDGNYEPSNCRWATNTEQMQNTSLTKVTIDKVKAIRADPRTHSVIAEEYGVDESTISRIIMRRTWKNIP